MLTETGLSTGQVLDVFTEEVEARGGTTRDVWVDDDALFARSVVGLVADVKRGDEVRGGVAIRASAEGIRLSPYVFRVVCTNGAIMSRAEETLVLDDLQFRSPGDVLATVRRGVVACADEEIFLDSVEDMRRSDEASDLMSVHVLTLLAHLMQSHRGLRGHASLRQFVDGTDRTLFALGNVITAIGRDTTEPRRKWELEELGGGVLVGALKPPPGTSGHAAAPSRAHAEIEQVWGGRGVPHADRWLAHASTSLRESSAGSLHS
jgi:hypothetical protein